MNVHLNRIALTAALFAATAAGADALNPQPLPPGRAFTPHAGPTVASAAQQGTPGVTGGKFGGAPKNAVRVPAPALINRVLPPGSKAELNPQPLPP